MFDGFGVCGGGPVHAGVGDGAALESETSGRGVVADAAAPRPATADTIVVATCKHDIV